MNKISKIAKIGKNLKIGMNNIIGDNVKIWDDVIIGNNNKIYDNTVIYPNTKIGDNNVILNNNILGEFAIEAKYDFIDKKFSGLEIGNHNYFHINNLIFNGYHHQSKIGNNNKILAELHMGHDVEIENNVVIYPRVLIGGFSKIQSNAGMGTGSYLQQNLKMGQYSFTAMLNPIVKNCFPFFIYKNNKPYRMNYHRVPKEWHQYEEQLLNNDFNNLPEEVINIIKKFKD